MPFEMQLSNMPESERAEAEACLTNQDPLQEPFENLHHFNNTVLEGGESWFRISGTPIFDSQGCVVGHRGKSLDVTREMAAKKQLQTEMTLAENSVKLKSGFMASMTHELRTPLNAIIGFTDILEAVDTAEERNEYIRIIRNNCDMMQRLISDILTASSLSDELSSVEQVDVDFAKAFEDICLTLQQRVPEHVKFLKDNPYHSFYTTLDIGRVNQIITNFVTNAVKFTHHGHIRLSYRYDGHGLRIICEDTGVGIPLDKQGIIFDRFVKLDEFVQGTGMGLNICKNIAQRLGGSIGVESEGKDKGSIFWVWIPCTRKQLPTDQ
jgi:signal transduction histidine kinase